MSLQLNRKYSLVIGDFNTGDAVEFNNHQITFDISRSSDYRMKTNSAAIEVYNISKAEEALINKEFIASVFKVAYQDDPLSELFSGQVVRSSTRKSGADRVTQIIMGEGYVDLTQNPITATLPAGKTVEDVLKLVVKNMTNVKRGVYKGTNINSKLLYGYPINGNPQKILDEICSAYQIKYHIRGKEMYFYDNRGSLENPREDAPLITRATGLIDTPFEITGDKGVKVTDKSQLKGIQFRKLIDPQIICGQIVKVKDGSFDGFYIVDEIRYSGDFRGGSWFMDVTATAISDFNVKGVAQIIEAQKQSQAEQSTEAAINTQLNN